MPKSLKIGFFLLFTIPFGLYGQNSQKEQQQLAEIEDALKVDIPHLMCVNQDFMTGGQPTVKAYAKLASNGFRSVLNLRTGQEGVDLDAEKEAVEKAGLRYINIPVVSSAPNPFQVTQFFKAVEDKSAQPMLIHCASANRVAAFWMIYRVLGQGWSEEKAFKEAVAIGLTNPTLKKFALDYISSRKN